MSDLMEDATDLSWQGAKVAHAVLCCQLESVAVSWQQDMNKTWDKSKNNKKPWFCKFYKNSSQYVSDHDVGCAETHMFFDCNMGAC